ncbi:MAG: hypothetical protein M0Z30_11530 [Actinomycetota bacterium]|nr:hypothetical protein [Actinomycetota bacterium]
MTMVLLCTGILVALAAAARSTYSPCGLSMLSSITPFGERARRHRYRVTAAWFVAGALLGGATLGAVSAGLAALVGSVVGTGPWTYATAAALTAAAALIDAGAFGPVLPLIRRQVDDRWLARYRPWVYGAGFGWQIGVGVATYLMTAGVLVVVALGVLSGSPLLAWSLGVVFGAARGVTVFLTAGASSAAELRVLHGRLAAAGAAVQRGLAGLLAGAAVGLAICAYLAGSALAPGLGAAVAGLGAVTGAVVGAASTSLGRAVAAGPVP